MKSNLLSLLIFCLATGCAAMGQTVDDLGMGQPSSFQFGEKARDPFWPIGWTKKVLVENVPGKPKPVEVIPMPDSFSVTSISLDRIPLAIINGKQYGVGDYFLWAAPTERGEHKTFRLQVISIRDGVVILRYGSVELSCPLRVLGNQPVKAAP